MPRRRDLKLDKYGISKEANRELRSFCLQYEEKKARLQQLRSIASAPITGMPGKNEPGNPTAKHAEMAVKLSNDIAMIEQSALEASGNLQQYIIQHVTSCLLYTSCGRSKKGEALIYQRLRQLIPILIYRPIFVLLPFGNLI